MSGASFTTNRPDLHEGVDQVNVEVVLREPLERERGARSAKHSIKHGFRGGDHCRLDKFDRVPHPRPHRTDI
jgi:hypothetical protein